MAFISQNVYKRMSDLVVNELDPVVGYSRQVLNVTPDALPLNLGTVVFRAKATDNTAESPYARLASADDLLITNEFAVVYGDHFSFNPSFVVRPIVAGQFNAVGFVGKNGALQLKEYFVKQVAKDAVNNGGAGLTDAQFETLRELLKAQGIILEITL